MLAAPSTTSSTATNTLNKYQSTTRGTFDSFDSPFYTPSVFNSNNAMMTSSSSILFNTTTTTKENDFTRSLYQHTSSSPESFFSVMADIESPAGTRTPSPKSDPYYYYYGGGDSTKREDTSLTTSSSSFIFSGNSTNTPPSLPPPPFLYNHQQQQPYQLKVKKFSSLFFINNN